MFAKLTMAPGFQIATSEHQGGPTPGMGMGDRWTGGDPVCVAWDAGDGSDSEASWIPRLIPELVSGHSLQGWEGDVFWLKARLIFNLDVPTLLYQFW